MTIPGCLQSVPQTNKQDPAVLGHLAGEVTPTLNAHRHMLVAIVGVLHGGELPGEAEEG